MEERELLGAALVDLRNGNTAALGLGGGVTGGAGIEPGGERGVREEEEGVEEGGEGVGEVVEGVGEGVGGAGVVLDALGLIEGTLEETEGAGEDVEALGLIKGTLGGVEETEVLTEEDVAVRGGIEVDGEDGGGSERV